MGRLEKNREVVKDSAIDIDVLVTVVDGNAELTKKLLKVKDLLINTSPSSDRSVIKFDKKINKNINKLKKKAPKLMTKGKDEKLLSLIKKLEILIVERGCRNRKETINDENDFIIKDGVLKQYVGKDADVVLPNSVKVIGAKAFYNSDTLVTLECNEGLTTIKEKAFEGCKALNSVYFPNSLAHIEDDAFYNCLVLNEVMIEKGLLSIGTYAFSKCPNLYAIKIPKSVNRIGEKAFFLDSKLRWRTKRAIKKVNKKALK